MRKKGPSETFRALRDKIVKDERGQVYIDLEDSFDAVREGIVKPTIKGS